VNAGSGWRKYQLKDIQGYIKGAGKRKSGRRRYVEMEKGKKGRCPLRQTGKRMVSGSGKQVTGKGANRQGQRNPIN